MNVYFTSLAALISGIFIASLGIYTFFKNKGSNLSRVFALTTFSFAIWLFGTYKMLIAGDAGDDSSAILWDRFIYIGVVFVPSLLYHFSLVFIKEIKQKKILILSYALSVFFLFISRTDYFVSGLFKYKWGVHTQANFFHHIFLIFFFVFIILSFKNLYFHYRKKNLTKTEKLQTRYIFLAFFLLIGIGSFGYLPAYNIGIYPFSFYSGLIFSVIVAYAILKYNFFDLKIVAAELITIAILLFSIVQIRSAKSANELLTQIIFLIIFIIFGILLIRSVNEEVRRREQIQQLAAELKTANEKLKELDELKSDFISIASHQLRTPLTTIKGLISMILEGTWQKEKDKEKEELEKVYLSAQRLINLVETLLNISRIESGRMVYNFESVSLEPIVESVINDLALLAKTKAIEITFEKPDEPLPKIEIDPLAIRQIMMNFIDNAIHYTPKGKIVVKLSRHSGILLTAGEKRQQEIIFSVADTGIGLSANQKERLFQKFSRIESGVRDGFGLGLYAAAKIIEAHQGKIGAESAGPDKGSTFWFTLPITK